MVGGGHGGEGKTGAVVFGGDFATTVGFGVAFVAFGARFERGFSFDSFAAVGEGVAVFAWRAVGDFGAGGGSLDTVAGGGIDDFAGWAGTELLINVFGGGSWGIGLLPKSFPIAIINEGVGSGFLLAVEVSERVDEGTVGVAQLEVVGGGGILGEGKIDGRGVKGIVRLCGDGIVREAVGFVLVGEAAAGE